MKKFFYNNLGMHAVIIYFTLCLLISLMITKLFVSDGFYENCLYDGFYENCLYNGFSVKCFL